MPSSAGKTSEHSLSVRRAVVSLSVYKTLVDWEQPYAEDKETRMGGGTAFVVDALPTVPTGFLALTAYHVVRNAVRIRATLFENDEQDLSTPLDATLVVYSVDLDTAVIHIGAPLPGWLAPLKAGDSNTLMPNVQIKVAGFPLRADFQVTTGFVSGRLPGRVQVDASVNPGNSGGPLISVKDGAVVGVVVSGYLPGKAQNVNFCTPYEDIRLVLLPTLLATLAQPASKAATITGVNDPVAVPITSFNFDLVPTSPDLVKARTDGKCLSGALVTRVHEGSSAYASGLRADDVVHSLDGHNVGYKATVRVPWWKVDALHYTTLRTRKPLGGLVDVAFFSVASGRVERSRFELEGDLSRFRYVDVQSEPIPYLHIGGVVVQPLTENLFEQTELLQERFGYVLRRPQLQERSLLIVTHIDADSPFTVMNQLTRHEAVVGVNETDIDGGDLRQYAVAFRDAIRTGMVLLRLYTGAVVAASADDVRRWHEAHPTARSAHYERTKPS